MLLRHAFLYGDMLMWIKNQVSWRLEKGSTDALATTWTIRQAQFDSLSYMRMKHNYQEMLHDADRREPVENSGRTSVDLYEVCPRGTTS
ncbi:MAG: hypothetical protein ACLTJG_02215 [[Clostridium] innocuum]